MREYIHWTNCCTASNMLRSNKVPVRVSWVSELIVDAKMSLPTQSTTDWINTINVAAFWCTSLSYPYRQSSDLFSSTKVCSAERHVYTASVCLPWLSVPSVTPTDHLFISSLSDCLLCTKRDNALRYLPIIHDSVLWQITAIRRMYNVLSALTLIVPKHVLAWRNKIYSTLGVDSDGSFRPLNLTSASCDLDLWPPDP